MDERYLHILNKDFKNYSKEFCVNFINSLSGFKSVNLCGTSNKDGVSNLAIFNTIIHVGSKPPLMGMLVRPPVVQRDTLVNIRETKYFTLNHIHQKFYTRAHQTAARYEIGKSEFEVVGFNTYYTDNCKAPYVAESEVKIGLKFREEHEIKSNCTILIVGEIIEVMVPKNAVLSDGLIDLGITKTITSSGLDVYWAPTKIARLSYARPDEDINVIG
ncbi:MAG: flavin reductase family protein [Bacteroidales bacterium]|nr:flavin reductase family protein [Bacteroidales bacterium]MCF8405453.1 flavin reductase family protein [Bacteroidales bacterium]